MDEYDVVPPSAVPQVNDGLPPEDTSFVEPGGDPSPEPEPEVVVEEVVEPEVVEEPETPAGQVGTETIEEQIARLEKEAADAQAAADAATEAANKAAEAEAAQAARVADRAAAVAGLPVQGTQGDDVNMQHLGDFEQFRFGGNNFQSDFQIIKVVDPKTGNVVNKQIEMWDSEAFGLKPRSWYESQGLTKPKVDVRKDRSVSTTIGPSGEQYTWDSKGNIMSGGSGWQVNPSDLKHILKSMSQTGVAKYRLPMDIFTIQKESIDAGVNYKKILAAQTAADLERARAQEALDKANQALEDARTSADAAKAEKARQEAADALAQVPTPEPTVTPTLVPDVVDKEPSVEQEQIIGDDIGLGGTGGEKGATWYMSPGTGLESLAVPADPIVVDDGIGWLVGGTIDKGATESGTPDTTTSLGLDDTSAPAGTYLSGDIALGIPDSNIQSQSSTEKSGLPVFGIGALDAIAAAAGAPDEGFREPPKDSWNPNVWKPIQVPNLIIPDKEGKSVMTTVGKSLWAWQDTDKKDTQPEFTVHPIQSTAKKARDLFSGF